MVLREMSSGICRVAITEPMIVVKSPTAVRAMSFTKMSKPLTPKNVKVYAPKVIRIVRNMTTHASLRRNVSRRPVLMRDLQITSV